MKIDLIIGLGRALSSDIPKSLRAAAARLEDYPEKSLLCISLFFNEEISEDERDDLEAALTEVSSSLQTNKPLYFDYTKYEQRHFPEPLPNVGVYAFSRDTILPRQIELKEMVGKSLYACAHISGHQALLGRIPSTLRSAYISEKNGKFFFVFYLDEGFDDFDILLLKQAAEAFIADFPEHIIDMSFQNWPFPRKIPQNGWGLFKRKEPYPEVSS